MGSKQPVATGHRSMVGGMSVVVEQIGVAHALMAEQPPIRRHRPPGRPPVQKAQGVALREAGRIRAAADLNSTAQVFAALGNTMRLRIVQMLSEQGPMTIAELRVALSVANIAGHLQTLIDAGIVERAGHKKMSGAPTIFALVDDALGAVIFLLR